MTGEEFYVNHRGDIAQVTDRKGQVAGLAYDNRNRLTQVGYGASVASPTSFAVAGSRILIQGGI